jgi:DNA-binding CsgD family transcriptional regulator
VSHELQLSETDFQDFLYLDDILHPGKPFRDKQEDLLQVLVRSLSSESGNFCLHEAHGAEARKDNTALFHLSWLYTGKYINHYHRTDPFLTVSPEAGAARDSDVMPWPLWQNLEFYTDFIRPQGIRHILVIYLQDGPHLWGHIGIHRWDLKSLFSERDLMKARLFARLISLFLKSEQSSKVNSDLEFLLKRVMDFTSFPLVILNSDLQPVYWNAKTLDSGLYPVPYRYQKSAEGDIYPVLPPEVINQCLYLKWALEHQKQRLICEKWRISLKTSTHPFVEIEVLPVGEPVQGIYTRFYFLVIFNDSVKIRSKRILGLASLWKLTPKEMEIIQYLCQGLANKEIAEKLYISLPTVATHISHIFQKTGFKNRSKLTSELRLP